MTLPLRYRPAAIADLDAIFAFIAADSPDRALGYIDDIRAHCRRLGSHPELGVARDDLATGIRVLPIRRRLVIAYRVADDAVVIMRVFSSGQDYEVIMRGSDQA
jgi:toxin ParE1/3/4